MATISETDVMKIIDDSLSQISDEAMKNRILKWASSKFSTEKPPVPQETDQTKPQLRTKHKMVKAHPAGKKQKNSLSIVKDLNLSPKGKKSFADFVKEKQPVSDQEKCIASVYHLQRNLEMEGITVNHVYTCYKIIHWRVPANLENTLAVTASQKGWLDTTDFQDIKTTTHGENLIEHDLPKKIKAK